MAVISANGSKGHHKFTLELNETSYNSDSNTSETSYLFTLSPIVTGYNWSGWGSAISWNVSINGTNYSGTIPNYDGRSTITLKIGSQTIQHNEDGTKVVDFSFSVSDTSGASYTCGTASSSGTLTLTPISRQTIKCYISGSWRNCVPYIYKSGAWKKCEAYIYKSGSWRKGK